MWSAIQVTQRLFLGNCMCYRIVLPILLVFSGAIAQAEDNAAIQYLLAFSDTRSIPECVANATTDDKEHGFSVLLSKDQTRFLQQTQSIAGKQRFLKATSFKDCDWGRFQVAQ